MTESTSFFTQDPMGYADGEIPLTDEQKRTIIERKYESTNPMISDTQHKGVWKRYGLCAHEKLGLTEDHGVIINLMGTSNGEIAIAPDGSILRGDAIDIREELIGVNLTRSQEFVFRVEKLTKTNGPQLREELQHTADQRRKEGEADMMDSIGASFVEAMQMLKEQGAQNTQTTNPAELAEFMKWKAEQEVVTEKATSPITSTSAGKGKK